MGTQRTKCLLTKWPKLLKSVEIGQNPKLAHPHTALSENRLRGYPHSIHWLIIIFLGWPRVYLTHSWLSLAWNVPAPFPALWLAASQWLQKATLGISQPGNASRHPFQSCGPSLWQLPGAFEEVFLWLQKATLGISPAGNASRRPFQSCGPSGALSSLVVGSIQCPAQYFGSCRAFKEVS